MSGGCSYFARTLYDNCSYYQELNQSTNPLNYALLVDNYENKQNSNVVFPCTGDMISVPCESCKVNKDANQTHTFDSIDKRIDIDSDLKLINYKLSRCNEDKFKPCPLKKETECNKVIPTVVLLCDRSIVPTNMKMPIDNGLSKIN